MPPAMHKSLWSCAYVDDIRAGTNESSVACVEQDPAKTPTRFFETRAYKHEIDAALATIIFSKFRPGKDS